MDSDAVVVDIFAVAVIAVIDLTTARPVVLLLCLDLLVAVVAIVMLLLLGEAFTHLLAPMATKL